MKIKNKFILAIITVLVITSFAVAIKPNTASAASCKVTNDMKVRYIKGGFYNYANAWEVHPLTWGYYHLFKYNNKGCGTWGYSYYNVRRPNAAEKKTLLTNKYGSNIGTKVNDNKYKKTDYNSCRVSGGKKQHQITNYMYSNNGLSKQDSIWESYANATSAEISAKKCNATNSPVVNPDSQLKIYSYIKSKFSGSAKTTTNSATFSYSALNSYGGYTLKSITVQTKGAPAGYTNVVGPKPSGSKTISGLNKNASYQTFVVASYSNGKDPAYTPKLIFNYKTSSGSYNGSPSSDNNGSTQPTVTNKYKPTVTAGSNKTTYKLGETVVISAKGVDADGDKVKIRLHVKKPDGKTITSGWSAFMKSGYTWKTGTGGFYLTDKSILGGKWSTIPTGKYTITVEIADQPGITRMGKAFSFTVSKTATATPLKAFHKLLLKDYRLPTVY